MRLRKEFIITEEVRVEEQIERTKSRLKDLKGQLKGIKRIRKIVQDREELELDQAKQIEDL